jgi:hypothetical protein
MLFRKIFFSKKHLTRHLNGVGLRWNQGTPELRTAKSEKLNILMKRLPPFMMLKSHLLNPPGRQVRRSANGGVLFLTPD